MTALLAWLWQGTALALVAALGLRACRRLDAATRHALWWAVLAAVLALPWLPTVLEPAALGPGSVGIAVPAPTSAAIVVPVPPDWLIAIALGAWLGTVVLGMVRLARGLAFLARVRRESLPLDPARALRLRLWNAAPASARRAELRVTPLVSTACAVGLGRGVIALPPSLLEAVDDETLDQIVMHERAHLERFDDAWRLVEAIVDAVAGLHPGVRIALGRIALEREAACDDRVVLHTGAADRYAACLADAAALARGPRGARQAELLSAAVSGRAALLARVSRLLDAGRRRRPRLTPGTTLAGVVVLSAAAAAAARIGPIVVFDAARAVEAPGPLAVADRRAPQATAPRQREGAGPALASVVTGAVIPVAVSTSGAPRDRAVGPDVRQALDPLAPAIQDRQVAESPAAAPAVLGSRALPIAPQAAPAAPAARFTPVGAGRESAWTALADGSVAVGNRARRGGIAVGTGGRKAGSAIAGFVARTGRAVARSF